MIQIGADRSARRRPTIRDLALAAGVSVATVNRVIGGSPSVRRATIERVRQAAESLGFYGLGAIASTAVKRLDRMRLGVLLQQPNRPFYKLLGETLRAAAAAYQDAKIELRLEYLEDLSPEQVAQKLEALAGDCDAVAVVAAEHPIVSSAIDRIGDAGVPVIALIAPLSAKGARGFVGIDNWKVGRTAAWTFDRLCKTQGKIGVLVGNHRYRNQELNESGFRSYFREHRSGFTLLEPLSTYESASVGREMTERLFAEHPDMCGLFISGGGVSGALAALRERRPSPDFVCVGYELMDVTRNALIDGALSLVIAHPLAQFGGSAIEIMVKACRAGADSGSFVANLQFEIYTSENV